MRASLGQSHWSEFEYRMAVAGVRVTGTSAPNDDNANRITVACSSTPCPGGEDHRQARRLCRANYDSTGVVGASASPRPASPAESSRRSQPCQTEPTASALKAVPGLCADLVLARCHAPS